MPSWSLTRARRRLDLAVGDRVMHDTTIIGREALDLDDAWTGVCRPVTCGGGQQARDILSACSASAITMSPLRAGTFCPLTFSVTRLGSGWSTASSSWASSTSLTTPDGRLVRHRVSACRLRRSHRRSRLRPRRVAGEASARLGDEARSRGRGRARPLGHSAPRSPRGRRSGGVDGHVRRRTNSRSWSSCTGTAPLPGRVGHWRCGTRRGRSTRPPAGSS